MKKKPTVITSEVTISSLADMLRKDVARKHLSPGDSYFNTADAARFLGVSTFLANRALQLLQKQNVLIRSQRTGATIAPAFSTVQWQPPSRVTFLLGEYIYHRRPAFLEKISDHLHSLIPVPRPSRVELPTRVETKVVDQFIAKTLAAKEHVWLILSWVPLTVQRHVENSGLPAVVLGGLYPSIRKLPNVDWDFHRIMDEVFAYFLQKKCRHIFILIPGRMFPGSHRLLDGVQAAMTQNGLSIRQLTIRCLPVDAAVCEAEVRLHCASNKQKTAYICGTPLFAEVVSRTAREAAKIPPPEICITNPTLDAALSQHFLRFEMNLEPEKIGDCVADCLRAFSSGPGAVNSSSTIPMKLVFPD